MEVSQKQRLSGEPSSFKDYKDPNSTKPPTILTQVKVERDEEPVWCDGSVNDNLASEIKVEALWLKSEFDKEDAVTHRDPVNVSNGILKSDVKKCIPQLDSPLVQGQTVKEEEQDPIWAIYHSLLEKEKQMTHLDIKPECLEMKSENESPLNSLNSKFFAIERKTANVPYHTLPAGGDKEKRQHQPELFLKARPPSHDNRLQPGQPSICNAQRMTTVKNSQQTSQHTPHFQPQDILKMHKMSMYPPNVNSLNCPNCQKSFRSHYKGDCEQDVAKRMPTKCWKCCMCDRMFSAFGHLRVHMAKGCTHHCKHCGMSFKDTSKYYTHMEHHKPPVSCKVCSKVYKNKRALGIHMKTHKKKAYICQLCGKGFSHKGSLGTHMLAHNDVRKFECTDCGAAFKLKSHLRRHQLMHTDERPFSCSVCGNGFRTNANLQAHMKTHTRRETEGSSKRKPGPKKDVTSDSEEEEEEEWQGDMEDEEESEEESDAEGEEKEVEEDQDEDTEGTAASAEKLP